MFSPLMKVTGLSAESINLGQQRSWVYVIFCYKHSLIYIGESFDSEGILRRLGSHFGPLKSSTLKSRAYELSKVQKIEPPYLVVACDITSKDCDSYDTSSKKTRLKIEADLHELFASLFISEHPGWNIISSATYSDMNATDGINAVVKSVYHEGVSAFKHYQHLSKVSPWNLVVLGRPNQNKKLEKLWDVIERIEVTLFEHLIDTLKKEGGDSWWSDMVPQNIRSNCVVRREEEKGHETMPPEAYLDLVSMRDIIKKNWLLFSSIMEKVSLEGGKDKATSWIIEINEVRKVLAHPLKAKFKSVSGDKEESIRRYLKSLESEL
ncbi:hypothetical protein [Pseudoalteromonas sp. OANN1]|uniref:hypothetical protein n=1 Tax=Pseudoalteromonas sp. OANN1 TaxID=2954497 RepID=UPI0020980E21|nr:hypothetical protein [Pseudoalteromonas sp. OANN1]MCO7199596.1 hypothetical protein [Pseudoalteromonas sp. OANN1]